MLTREGELRDRGGHRQSLDDDARGGLRPLSPGASSSAMPREHRFAMLRSLRDLRSSNKSNRNFDFFAPHAFARERRHGASNKFQSPFALARFRSPRSLEQIVQFVHFLCSFEKNEKKSFEKEGKDLNKISWKDIIFPRIAFCIYMFLWPVLSNEQ